MGELSSFPPCSTSLGHRLEDVLDEGLHVRPAAHVLAEKGLEHAAVGAEQGGQAHEQTGVVHQVAGSGHTHVLVEKLLDHRVELVDGAGAGQSGVAWGRERETRENR